MYRNLAHLDLIQLEVYLYRIGGETEKAGKKNQKVICDAIFHITYGQKISLRRSSFLNATVLRSR